MPARLPPPVLPGDRVGVAALSGSVDAEKLNAGIDALADLGFDPVRAPNLKSRDDLFAGSDEERLAGLDELLADETIGAVFFARGGHGILRLLSRFDWRRLGRRPRAWIGYSDLTPLLNLIVERLDCVSFHGPMVAVELAAGLDDAERDSLLAALAGELPARFPGRLASGTPMAAPSGGPLRGGCLSMLCALLGTPYQLSLDGAVLALEDVGEPVYRIDRMLTHLALSGSLAAIRGVVLGGLRGSDEDEVASLSIPERIKSLLPEVPLLSDVEFGHQRPQLTLPLGLPAHIDVVSRSLILEPPRDER